jgi:hypothetical protein
MSVHPFPRRSVPRQPVAAHPIEPYYQSDRGAEAVTRLRPMTAVEEMYAYWGWDRE